LYNVKDDGSYQLYKEIMMPAGSSGSRGSGGDKSSVIVILCEGQTVAEAARDEYNGRALFGGNLKARIFTEKLARYGMVPTMDFLSRDPLTDEKTI
jgi:hypothetical protein